MVPRASGGMPHGRHPRRPAARAHLPSLARGRSAPQSSTESRRCLWQRWRSRERTSIERTSRPHHGDSTRFRIRWVGTGPAWTSRHTRAPGIASGGAVIQWIRRKKQSLFGIWIGLIKDVQDPLTKHRQILLDHPPDQLQINAQIIVHKHILEPSQSRPIDIWMTVLQHVRQPLRRFGHRLQVSQDRILPKWRGEKLVDTYLGGMLDPGDPVKDVLVSSFTADAPPPVLACAAGDAALAPSRYPRFVQVATPDPWPYLRETRG